MSSQTYIWETSENPTLQPGTWPLASAYFVYCVCSCLCQASLGFLKERKNTGYNYFLNVLLRQHGNPYILSWI